MLTADEDAVETCSAMSFENTGRSAGRSTITTTKGKSQGRNAYHNNET
jgi:hypothetical protein